MLEDYMKFLSQHVHEVIELKKGQIQQNRISGQNNPITRRRKSEAMKAYWKNKKIKEQKEREEEEYRASYVPESCYCHMGNPPCGFCTREVDNEE